MLSCFSCQAPLSIGFFREEYWSGLPFPSPGDLPDPGLKPRSPTLQANALTSAPPGKPLILKRERVVNNHFYHMVHKKEEDAYHCIEILSKEMPGFLSPRRGLPLLLIRNRGFLTDPKQHTGSLLLNASWQCTTMFIAALLKTETWKHLKRPLTDGWVKRMWRVYTTEYYWTIEKNKMMLFAATWMWLEIIILSEESQKDKYRMISLIRGL